ncbi:radical SAM protein [Pseudodesulfovibrio sp.]|uniref:radical SAM protein n=1 Tax=unclassified Pseudodesulfovibrio TaxID=2661612 RepID=UPI003AFFC45E
MADKFRIDSHKLMFHPERVSNWLEGENTYPIYMEISPSGACNNRCVFCGKDFMEYKPRFLDTEVLKVRLKEMAELGVKSIMHAGEGEPFLHKDMAEIVRYGKSVGIDQAFTTNASLMKPEIAEQILEHTTWIKASCNAGTPESYAKIHRTKASDFNKVLENMEAAVKLRAKHGYACTLGMQILLLPETQHEVVGLAEKARDIGLDYLVVKPYSHHPKSLCQGYKDVDYSHLENLGEELAKTATPTFQPLLRLHAIDKWQAKDHSYNRCLGLPFWAYMDAGGTVWGCSMFLNDDRFNYGNINDQTFREIWEGEKRTEAMKWFNEKFDSSSCRVNCRMDEVNRYLWELKHPGAHVNFI